MRNKVFLEFGRLVPGGLIGLNTAWGEDGLELFGLDPELEIVTVAGETRGVADRLTEGDARADRIPPAAAGLGMPTTPGRKGRPGEMLDRMPGVILVRRPGEMFGRKPGEILFLRGSPGEMLDLCRPGETTATAAALSLAAVLPLVAARLLLLWPPPGGGPVSDNSARHFLTKLLARFARSLSEVFLLRSLMCLPNRVA